MWKKNKSGGLKNSNKIEVQSTVVATRAKGVTINGYLVIVQEE
jgi:hypothetical protein